MEACAGEKEEAVRRKKEVKLARRFREGLVKSSAIIGLPKTINALMALKTGTPPHCLDPAPEFASPENLNSSATGKEHDNPRWEEIYGGSPAEVMQRGTALFDTVYGKVSQRVMGQLASSASDLALVARLEYGYILSARSDILNPVETSCVLLAGLIPQDVNPQLKGHLKGMVNNGASVEEVRAVRDMVIKICEVAGMKQLKEDDKGFWGWSGDVAKL